MIKQILQGPFNALLPLQQTGEDMDEVKELSVCLRCQNGQEEMVEESQLPGESFGYEVGKVRDRDEDEPPSRSF